MKKSNCYSLVIILYLIAAPAYAYIDPSAGSLWIQSLIAIFATIATVVSRWRKIIYMFKIAGWIRRFFAVIHRFLADYSKKTPNPPYFLISPATPANLFITLHLFLFLPVLLFMRSRSFWNYGFDDYFVVLFPLFIVAYGLLSIPIFFVKRQFHRHYAAILTGIAFAAWVSDWFVGSDGVLDGKTFVLVTDPAYFYNNLFTIAVVGISCVAVGYYKPKITNTILLLASFAFAVIVIAYTLMEHKVSFLNYQQSQQELTTFSKQKNVLLILLDSFQSDFFQEILSKKPLWAHELEGFTFYLDAASTAPGTMLSLPTIHSSKVYHQGENLEEFYKKNIEEESFVKLLQAHGYRAMILNPYFGYAPPEVARVNQNYLSCTRFGAFCEVSQLVSYSLFNSVPHLLKKYVYNEGFWLLPQYFPPAEIVSNQVLSTLASHLNTDSAVPTIKFLHLYGAHAPAILDQSCQLRQSGATWTRESAINQAECAMGHVIKVVHTLKQQHIYNQTAILIIADHGAGLPLDRDANILTAAGNPLLLFKSFNQTAKLNYSKDQVSLIDIKEMVCEATNDCFRKGSTAHNLAATLKSRQSLPFDYYKLNKMQNIIKVFPYKIVGSPRDPNSWIKVPPSKEYVHNLAFMSDTFEDYAGSGWGSGGEQSWLRWAVGKEAEIYLPLPPNKDLRISLTATTHRQNPDQELSVWINNTFIGKFPIAVGRYSRIAFDVPKEIITKKPAHIQLRFAKSNRLAGQVNQYPLAVGFYGFLYVT